MGRMIKFLLVTVVVLFLRLFLRHLFSGMRSVTTRPESQAPAGASELKKDPVCGTYIPAASSITKQIDGKLLHFCSEECRNKYRAA
jgi:YHS domain-containing protein